MPHPGGEPPPGREPEVAVQVAEVAQDPGAAAEDLDLLILEARHLAFQPAPLPLDHAQVLEGCETPLDDRTAGAGHLHDRAPQLGHLGGSFGFLAPRPPQPAEQVFESRAGRRAVAARPVRERVRGEGLEARLQVRDPGAPLERGEGPPQQRFGIPHRPPREQVQDLRVRGRECGDHGVGSGASERQPLVGLGPRLDGDDRDAEGVASPPARPSGHLMELRGGERFRTRRSVAVQGGEEHGARRDV